MHTRGMGLFISLCVLIVVLAGCGYYTWGVAVWKD